MNKQAGMSSFSACNVTLQEAGARVGSPRAVSWLSICRAEAGHKLQRELPQASTCSPLAGMLCQWPPTLHPAHQVPVLGPTQMEAQIEALLVMTPQVAVGKNPQAPSYTHQLHTSGGFPDTVHTSLHTCCQRDSTKPAGSCLHGLVEDGS